MASTPVRPSPLSPFESANSRQSPFRRQNSVSPATVRATTPTQSPTKASSSLSPTKHASLSPEKTSPFVRRPSQMNNNAGRPTSPFARPTSSLSLASSPTRKSPDEYQPKADFVPTSPSRFANRQPSVTPVSDEDDLPHPPTSPTRFIPEASIPASPTLRSPPTPTPQVPSQASLRPAAPRPLPATTSTTPNPIAKPIFPKPSTKPTPSLPTLTPGSAGTYTHLAPGLLHSMRESFEVLDSNNTGAVGAAAVAEMLSQLNLAHDAGALSAFFPPRAPAQLNLARYLDVLSGPLGELSAPEELRAAFEAFDLDDSGQIDLGTLRTALLRSSSGDEEFGMGEGEVDAVLGEFTGRKAFGLGGRGGGKGEVFRYRDFMASVSAGGMGVENGNEAGVAA